MTFSRLIFTCVMSLAITAFSVVGLANAAAVDPSGYQGGTLWSEAKKYCTQRGGRLPTVAEMKAIQSTYAGLGLHSGRYWTQDVQDTVPLVIEMKTGSVETFPHGMRFTAVCADVAAFIPPTVELTQKPLFGTWEQAKANCAAKGKRLPSVKDLQFIAGRGIHKQAKWPDMIYWSREEAPRQAQHRTVLLRDGVDTYYSDGMRNFAICVD